MMAIMHALSSNHSMAMGLLCNVSAPTCTEAEGTRLIKYLVREIIRRLVLPPYRMLATAYLRNVLSYRRLHQIQTRLKCRRSCQLTYRHDPDMGHRHFSV